jgi:hypothetical protein
MQFVCEFALENARNAVLELQKCKTPFWGSSDTPFLRKISMTVEINEKKLYYNYYTSDKFLTLKFKFQVKPPPPPPPPPSQLQMLRYVPDSM